MIRLIKLIFKSILLLLALGAIASVCFNKFGGKQHIEQLITKSISNKLRYKVEVNGVKLSPNYNLKICSITLSDSEGVWLKIDHLKLFVGFSLQSLLKPNIQLAIKDMTYLRTPKPSKEFVNNSDDNSNFNIFIRNFCINNLTILPQKTDKFNPTYTVTGFLNWLNKSKILEFYTNVVLPKLPNVDQLSRINVDLAGTYDPKHNIIELKNINSNSNLAKIKGNLKLELDKEKYNGEISFVSNDVNKLSPDFKGQLDSLIEIEGINSNVNFKTKSAGVVEYKQNDPVDITGKTNGDYSLSTKNGNLSLDLQNGLKGNFDFSYLNNLIKLNNVNLRDKFNNAISGDVIFSTNKESISGDINIKGTNLNHYNHNLTGSYTASA